MISHGPGAAPTARRTAVVAELLRSGQAVRLTATGSSMAPAIRSGDIVMLAPAGEDSVRIGDIVLVACQSSQRLHRVVSVAPLQTRGDNLDGVDPPPDEVLGRVQSVRKSPYSIARTMAHRLRHWFRA